MKLKILGLGVLALIVVMVGAMVLLFSSLDSIVKSAIETYGSEITGTSVRVGSVHIEITEGKGSIRGLRIANPDGFSSGDAISFGEITLGIDINSVKSRDPIVVSVVNIAEPSVALVMNEKAKSNLKAIMNNVDRFAASGGGDKGSAEEASEPSSGGSTETPLVIRNFSIAGGMVAADLTALGGPKLDSKIPPIHLTNVGGNRGSPPGVVGAKIAGTFLKSVLNSVASSQIQASMNKLLGNEEVSKGLDAAKDLMKGLLRK